MHTYHASESKDGKKWTKEVFCFKLVIHLLVKLIVHFRNLKIFSRPSHFLSLNETLQDNTIGMAML